MRTVVRWYDNNTAYKKPKFINPKKKMEMKLISLILKRAPNVLEIILAFLRIEEVGTLDIAISSVEERLIFLNLLQKNCLENRF